MRIDILVKSSFIIYIESIEYGIISSIIVNSKYAGHTIKIQLFKIKDSYIIRNYFLNKYY
jgi:hypothetical protein